MDTLRRTSQTSPVSISNLVYAPRGGTLALLGSDTSGRPLLARLLPLAGFDFGPDLLNGLVYIALEVLGNAQDRILSGEAVCADGPH